jgi:hypothetical protein
MQRCDKALTPAPRTLNPFSPPFPSRTWLCKDAALCLGFGACDAANGIVSVGTIGGNVDVYRAALVQQDVMTVSITMVHTLSLEPWGYTPSQLRPVVAVEWDYQGKALACLFGGGGMALWSLSGCRTACSLLSAESLAPSSMTGAHPRGLGSREPSSISWSREGYRVVYGLASGAGTMQDHNLLRPGLSDVRTGREGSGRLLIRGEDRILLPPEIAQRGRGEDMLVEAEDSNKELISEGWRHVSVPSMYIEENWPLRDAASDGSGR